MTFPFLTKILCAQISLSLSVDGILGLLDWLLFLSRGQTIFSSSPAQLPSYFADFGWPIPDSENKTEFDLDLIRELEGFPGGTQSLVEFNTSWHSAHYRSATDIRHVVPLQEAISAGISRGKLVSGATNNDASPNSMVPTFANPIWIEIAILAKRSMKNSRRMSELFGIRLGAIVVTGFILATMFWNKASKILFAPKVYPYENLRVELGGEP